MGVEATYKSVAEGIGWVILDRMSQERRPRWTTTGLVAPGSNSVRAISEGDMRVVFQPIVNLSSGKTFAYEALARCTLPNFESPAVLFEKAAAEQACGRLGRVVRNVLFETCGAIPVFVNVHPQEAGQRWLVQPTDPLFLHEQPVYLEVTESAAFEAFDVCMQVLHEVRDRCGARIVVDDFGAGYSDLQRVMALKPDVVKLDMSLVRDLDRSADKQRYVGGLVRTCHQLGATVVAEGIETAEELRAVSAAGADLGQGYFLGRPVYPPTVAKWPRVSSVAS
jgi:EAL domain-containing protein (putative c-di-GMP-specific phosphodiesterase class I)